jgi:eukaryotic-like serine/threonine-protein kinase
MGRIADTGTGTGTSRQVGLHRGRSCQRGDVVVGRIVADRYRLDRLLGRGGMGEVWAAHDTVIQRNVAVKLLQSYDGDDSTELFFREARTAGGLNHPGVVTVHDIGQDADSTLYLVMELLPGRDLAATLRHTGQPTIADAVDWATQTADALAAAHSANIVHRDLKPANLMLTPSGIVKILDFGIARYASTVTQASRLIGTPHYMPPERLLGKAGDGRGDLYSLGCLLYEVLTGATPFGDLDTAGLMYAHLHRDPELPSVRRPAVPAALDRLVLDLLAKSPADRPATAEQVRDRLRALAALRAAPTARPASVLDPAPPKNAAPVPVVAPRRADADPEPLPPAPPTHPATVLDAPAAGSRLPAAAPRPAPDYDAAAHRTETRMPLGAARRQPLRPPVPPASAPAARPSRSGMTRRRVLGLGITAALATGGGIAVWAAFPTRSTKWTFTAGGNVLSSTPAVANGLVYVGSEDNNVYALDAATGTVRWTRPAAASVGYSSPAVADSTVYIADMNYAVYALDAVTGKVKWLQGTRGGVGLSSPAVSGGVVYIGSADGYNGTLYALDAATGAVKWSYTTVTTAASAGDFSRSLPTVVDGTVYVNRSDGTVYALRADTGKLKWTYTPGGGSGGSSTPAIGGGTVYSRIGQTVYALNADTGTVKWTNTTVGGLISSPTVVGGTVYIGGDAKGMTALDAATGTVKWAHATGGAFGVPAVVGDTVYISSQDDQINALDTATGAMRWTYTTGDGEGTSSPTVADGTVYFSNGDTVYALDAATGGRPRSTPKSTP